MEVDKIYQDDQGKWHIEYSTDHLIGLAFRVYIGQLLIAIYIGLPLALLIAAIASA
ncbi:MAG: hypothetical protein AAF383_24275 [Cyanobacteria bacterium P01_A01_bin.83]